MKTKDMTNVELTNTLPVGIPLSNILPESSVRLKDEQEVAPRIPLTSREGPEENNVIEYPNKLAQSVLVRKGILRDIKIEYAGGRPYFMGVFENSVVLSLALAMGELQDFLDELTSLYRNIFAGPPWNEYICCSNPNCDSIVGISELQPDFEMHYGDIANFERSTGFCPEAVRCKTCHAEMKFYYPVERLQQTFRENLQKEMVGSLLFDDTGALVGFSMGSISTARDCWNDKVIPGEKDKAGEGLSFETYLNDLGTYFTDISPDSPAFNYAEWGIAPRARNSGLGLKILRSTIIAAAQKMQLPLEKVFIINHTIDHSTAIKLLKAIGWKIGQKLPGGKVRVYSLGSDVKGIDECLERMRKR